MTIEELWEKIELAGDKGVDVEELSVDGCEDALGALFSFSLKYAKNLHFALRDEKRFVVAGLRPQTPKGNFFTFFKKREENDGASVSEGA